MAAGSPHLLASPAQGEAHGVEKGYQWINSAQDRERGELGCGESYWGHGSPEAGFVLAGCQLG